MPLLKHNPDPQGPYDATVGDLGHGSRSCLLLYLRAMLHAHGTPTSPHRPAAHNTAHEMLTGAPPQSPGSLLPELLEQMKCRWMKPVAGEHRTLACNPKNFVHQFLSAPSATTFVVVYFSVHQLMCAPLMRTTRNNHPLTSISLQLRCYICPNLVPKGQYSYPFEQAATNLNPFA